MGYVIPPLWASDFSILKWGSKYTTLGLLCELGVIVGGGVLYKLPGNTQIIVIKWSENDHHN